ncbi:DUSAM domain-containing protein [Hyalangium versicolor]|uniref:DUSAM domain-containing protein n=1 Tax=Hyalangium versicolor TaxID=2861190 RepID=UPI001CCBA824|nr:DUSAM domain-containing protein [Hyalangium versicolor]
MSTKADWDLIGSLAQRVLEGGEPLGLTNEVRALLQRSARQVVIPTEDVKQAFRNSRTATVLLRRIRQCIRAGSRRLDCALSQSQSQRDAGDLKGARKVMEAMIAVEVVPFYRELAANSLSHIDRLQAVAESGQLDPKLPDVLQAEVLLHRVQRGKSLELTRGMGTFLRRVAAEAGISKAEAKEALSNPESAEGLLRRIVERRRKGTKRLIRALIRMVALRDAGDIEGARQQMRDLLAVEVVPVYRQAAEENLAGLDEPLPAP